MLPPEIISSNYRYTIEDLMGADRYMVDIKVEICLEKDKPCMISKEITKDLYLPKLGCDWSLDFSRKFMVHSQVYYYIAM